MVPANTFQAQIAFHTGLPDKVSDSQNSNYWMVLTPVHKARFFIKFECKEKLEYYFNIIIILSLY